MNKRLLIIIVGVIGLVLISIATIFIIKFIFYKPIIINGDSMSPTLENGKVVTVNIFKEPKRYDLVAIKVNGHVLVRRIYGLPGDHVVVKDGKIFINNEEIQDQYGYGKTIGEADIDLKGPDYFVLADNRETGIDSRTITDKRGIKYSFGHISKKRQIIGVVN